MTIAAWLQRNACAHAHDPALAIGPRPLKSYAELARAVAAIAGWLKDATKLRPAPVAIISDNRPEAFEALLACWWAGAAAATIDPRAGGPFVAEAVERSGARVVFACSNGARAIVAHAKQAPERLVVFGGYDYRRAESHQQIELQRSAQNAPAWIRFGEAADGKPRAAVFTHRALMHMALSILAELDAATPRDAQIHAESWCGESGLMMLPVLARAGINIVPESAGADAAEIFEIAGAWRRASLITSPQLLADLTSSDMEVDTTSFRSILIGGAPAPSDGVIAALERFGPRLAKVYGRAEFPLGLARLNRHDVAARAEPGWRERLDTAGRAFLTTEIAAFDGAGRELPPGEVGELCAKGPLRMHSYWRDAHGTHQAMRREWLRTGDQGSIDQSGHVRLLGRSADLLRCGAKTLPPDAVEAALRAEPSVRDAAVIQLRNGAEHGPLAAFLSLDQDSPPLDDPDLARRLSARAADAIGAPLGGLRLREALRFPRDLSGALDRAALRRAEIDHADGQGSER
ncbi:MAG: AMP-binding protein [Neomegalonema sp.]|nr:AMP-binding protein [Neomegalonema sp.]